MTPELRAVIKRATQAGGVMRSAGQGGHRIFRFPNGRTLTVSMSPSDRMAYKNANKQLDRILIEGTK